jgi:hypothetical protein
LSARDAHDAFYAHKREAHKGEYKHGCADCERLWARYLQASKDASVGRA